MHLHHRLLHARQTPPLPPSRTLDTAGLERSVQFTCVSGADPAARIRRDEESQETPVRRVARFNCTTVRPTRRGFRCGATTTRVRCGGVSNLPTCFCRKETLNVKTLFPSPLDDTSVWWPRRVHHLHSVEEPSREPPPSYLRPCRATCRS